MSSAFLNKFQIFFFFLFYLWRFQLFLCPCSIFQKEKNRSSRIGSLHGIRQRPTLPGRLQPSTIGAEGLNFCVRYGYRWFPFAIATGISRVRPPLRSRFASVSHPENCTSSFPTSCFAINQSSLLVGLDLLRSQDPWIKSSTD